MGDQMGDAPSASTTSLVAVEAEVELGDFGERLGPLGAEDAGTARGGDCCEPITFQDEPVELALAR